MHEAHPGKFTVKAKTGVGHFRDEGFIATLITFSDPTRPSNYREGFREYGHPITHACPFGEVLIFP
jgi:hypothetical protein